jgi:hypothetical protein
MTPRQGPAGLDQEPCRTTPGEGSESGFLAEIRRDWLCLFPHLPHQSEVNRR